MIGTTPNSNGRTGTQKLLAGIGAALAVLVLTSMLAAPAAADPPKESKWKSTDGEDLVLEAGSKEVAQVADLTAADGENTLETGDFILKMSGNDMKMYPTDLADGGDIRLATSGPIENRIM